MQMKTRLNPKNTVKDNRCAVGCPLSMPLGVGWGKWNFAYGVGLFSGFFVCVWVKSGYVFSVYVFKA